MSIRVSDVAVTTSPQVLGRVSHPTNGGNRIRFTVRVPSGGSATVSLGPSTVTAADGDILSPGQQAAVWNASKGDSDATQVWYIVGSASTTVKLTEVYTD